MAAKSMLPAISPDGNLSRYLDQIRAFPMLEPEPVFWPTRSWPPKGKCNPIPMEPRLLSILGD